MRQGAAKLWQCDMSPAQCFVIVYSLRLIIRSWLVHDVGQGPLIRFSFLHVPVVNSIIAGFVKLPRWNLFSLLSWFAFCFTMHIHTYFLVLSIHVHSCFIIQWLVVVWSFWCRISSLVFNSYTCLLGGYVEVPPQTRPRRNSSKLVKTRRNSSKLVKARQNSSFLVGREPTRNDEVGSGK